MEEEVRWTHLENSSDLIIGGPADILISIFHSRTRKQICLDSAPACMKKQKIGSHEAFLSLSQRKAQKALDKEIPFSRIPEKDKQAYQIAEKKEWDS